jgi:hypothetical protein
MTPIEWAEMCLPNLQFGDQGIILHTIAVAVDAAVREERGACAQIAEGICLAKGYTGDRYFYGDGVARDTAEAIRARSP